MLKSLKKYWPYLLLAILVVIFWNPVLFNNNFFLDDWDFVHAAQAGEPTFSYLVAPHNEHFMPVFKLIFYGMFLLFGANIVPYIWLLLIVHIINTGLFYYLCKLIFPKHKHLPLYLAVFFLSNSVYFEVLHWFILLCTAMGLMFLQITLILLHKYEEKKKKEYLILSALASFFIPMNFSLGIIGIVFILLYYFLVIKKSYRIAILKKALPVFIPYFIAWAVFMVLYYFFVVTKLAAKGLSMGLLDIILKVFERVAAGFAGFVTKTLGLEIFLHPINIWIGAWLWFNVIVFAFMLVLYFFLNRKGGRIALLNDHKLALFAFGSAFISYAVIALGRVNESPEFFLNYGRYQFFAAFFLVIFLGNLMPSLIKIFSGIFNPKRFKIYLMILFCLYLIGQLMIIREKALSGIRTEGLIINQTIYALEDRDTSKDTLAATFPS